MEHFASPFVASDFESDRALDNRLFFDALLGRAQQHRCFSHPLGDIDAAPPALYLRMLRSIGFSAETVESTPTLQSIERINAHLQDVVARRHFSVACAVLASAEATIPGSFASLAQAGKNAYPHMDMEFFDRHGVRDEGHSADAAMLFAATSDTAHFRTAEAAVQLDLDYRSELFDEWLAASATLASFG